MRILTFLNPTNKHGTKGAYTKLRKFLESDGYIMMQPEVFMRVCTNRKSALKHMNRLEHYNPGSGQVRILHLTEKQYSNMIRLTGEDDYQERTVGSNYHIML